MSLTQVCVYSSFLLLQYCSKFAPAVLVIDFNWAGLWCVWVVEELGKVRVREDLVDVLVALRSLEHCGLVSCERSICGHRSMLIWTWDRTAGRNAWGSRGRWRRWGRGVPWSRWGKRRGTRGRNNRDDCIVVWWRCIFSNRANLDRFRPLSHVNIRVSGVCPVYILTTTAHWRGFPHHWRCHCLHGWCLHDITRSPPPLAGIVRTRGAGAMKSSSFDSNSGSKIVVGTGTRWRMAMDDPKEEPQGAISNRAKREGRLQEPCSDIG